MQNPTPPACHLSFPIRFEDEDAIAQVLRLQSQGWVQARQGPTSKSHRHYGKLLWIDVLRAEEAVWPRLEAMKSQRQPNH